MSDDVTPIYFRVSPSLWRARSWTDDMRLLACYLLTSPHRTLEGLFILPKGYICGDLQWSAERLAEPFAGLVADGFLAYDETAEVCLLVKALKYQRPENPNMDKAAIRRIVAVPESRLDGLFLASAQQYAKRFAARLAERLPERFGKPQLCSSSTQLNPALTADDDPEPVDNSAEPERGCSIEPEGQGQSCDGAPCLARDFPSGAFAPLRRAIAASKRPEQWKEVGTNGALDALLAAYAGHVCAACQADLGQFERPQRDGLCNQAVVAAVESLSGSQDVAAVMRSRLTSHWGLLKLIGDRKLEELRRTHRDKRRRGAPRALSECLPPAFAQPHAAAKNCEPEESGAVVVAASIAG